MKPLTNLKSSYKFISFALFSIFIMSNTIVDKLVLYDFSKDSSLKNWRIINDDVMGGISKSTFGLNSEGHGEFKGKVSTANYGGFASVRYRFSEKTIKQKSTVVLRVKGDSKNYQFRLKANSNSYISYISTFSTSKKWQTVKIKLSDLYPSFRGRKLNKPNYKASTLEEVSILIANKKDESFKLLIDKIYLE